MACNNLPLNGGGSRGGSRGLNPPPASTQIASIGGSGGIVVEAVSTYYLAYLSQGGSGGRLIPIESYKNKNNEKIGNIERDIYMEVVRRDLLPRFHLRPKTFVTTTRDEEANLSEQSGSEERVERTNGGVWLFVKGIGSFVGTEEEIPANWGVKECAENLRGER